MKRRTSSRSLALGLALLTVACAPDAAPGDAGEGPDTGRYGAWADPLAGLPHGVPQLERVCAREGDDAIRDLFCGGEPPQITGLIELKDALGLQTEGLTGLRGFSLAGHSTSLGSRSISTINPRLVVIQLEPMQLEFVPPPYPELLALAFARGEQFVELMVRDRKDHELRFYLLTFRQACNDAAEGCVPGDLLTPEIERNWLETTLYDEKDLENTVLDCATCHQPNGPGSAKILRMQELETPWTHWFFRSTDGGRALLADYFAAKADEPIAGISAELIQRRCHPGSLNMQALFAGGYDQPNIFPSQPVEDEVRASAAALGGNQPFDNSIPGESATWREGYERSKRGEAITFPYHDVKITDPAKLARMTAAYQAYLKGEIDRRALPDIRDVSPDDEMKLAKMGMMTEPGMSGEEVLLQACSMCHNARLDQSLSRARFRANLEGMSRAEKKLAIERLKLPPEDPRAMPPARTRTLSDEARQRAIAVLSR